MLEQNSDSWKATPSAMVAVDGVRMRVRERAEFAICSRPADAANVNDVLYRMS